MPCHSLAWRRIHGPVPAKIGHCRRARRSSLNNEAQCRRHLGFSHPNYAQRGLSTLVLMFDLIPPLCLKGPTFIVFTEQFQTEKNQGLLIRGWSICIQSLVESECGPCRGLHSRGGQEPAIRLCVHALFCFPQALFIYHTGCCFCPQKYPEFRITQKPL